MKIYWRWLTILFTCGLGRHAGMRTIHYPGDVTYTECTRCHHAIYTRPGLPRDVHLRPSAWEVARGLYDRELE